MFNYIQPKSECAYYANNDFFIPDMSQAHLRM